MRILYHHRTLGDGAEGIHIREIINSLRKQGHEVKYVSVTPFENLGTPKTKKSQESASSSSGPGLLGKVKQLLPGFVFELAEIAYSIIGYRMIMKAAAEFKPDAIYDRYISYNRGAVWAARRLGLPMLLEFNSPYATQRKEWGNLSFPGLIQKHETWLTNNCDKVIVVSSALKDHLLKHGTREDQIIVMPNGTDPEVFDPAKFNGKFRQEYNIDKDDVVIGFVGILREWHRIPRLLDAFSELDPDKNRLKIVFVGYGDIIESLKAHAAKLGIGDRVIFTGKVPHVDMPHHVAIFDVAISPAVTIYSSPMKILEYMSMGKCVIAPDLKNIRDLIKPGETGILFDPDSKDDMKRALRQAVEDTDLRKRIGQTAIQDIRENYTWDKNAAEVVELFDALKKSRN